MPLLTFGERQQHHYSFHLLCFGVLLAEFSVYSLFWGQRGRVRSGADLARLVRARDLGSSCSRGWVVQVTLFFWTEWSVSMCGLWWGGAVAVGFWSVSLTTHLTGGPHAPPAHTPRTSTLSVSNVLQAFPCLSLSVASLISCLSCSVSALLLSSVCPDLFVSFFSVCPSLCLLVPVFL